MENKKTRSEWRKLAKKLQRKKRRQKLAKEREQKEEEESLARQNDANYQLWLKQQKELEEFEKIAEAREHEEQEEEWLRRELLAQKQFRVEEEGRKANEAAKEAIRLQQQKELEEREAAQNKRNEEKERLQAEAITEFERVLEQMEFYLSNEGSQTPNELKRFEETRPKQKLCEFYERTNCCRFGYSCTFNHRRPLLSKILLIHHFFMHPLLKETEHKEYETSDSHLEMNERDLRADYDEFFEDTCAELETFGKILNFRCVRNVLPHLRGNVFVEYEKKRSALKAFSKLQGRYYASRRLVVEFSNLVTWRGAVCGLSLARKCPRGLKCGYLHLFKNPGNKYNTNLENTMALESERKNRHTPKTPTNGKSTVSTPLLTWDDVSPYVSRQNWRWSESPEPETFDEKIVETKSTSTTKKLKRSRSKESSKSNRSSERNSSTHRRSNSPSSSTSKHHRHKTKKRKNSKDKSKSKTTSKGDSRKKEKDSLEDKKSSKHKKKTK